MVLLYTDCKETILLADLRNAQSPLDTFPEGPWFLIPTTVLRNVFGTKNLSIWVLGVSEVQLNHKP